ncbi:MAG: hypothetical protein J4469_02590 [Candidatus Aenigmarchaeota archaeon]|nr:hypothetical protein [Candidatus Aenigmarchaeota archaeon]
MQPDALPKKDGKTAVVGEIYTETELKEMGLEYLHPMDGLRVYRNGFERYYVKELPDGRLHVCLNVRSTKWK